jgi:methylthioribulose-1-phosphate dehydratase
MSFKINDNDQKNLHQLAELVRKLNTTGHNPATSGNYSHRSDENKDFAFVSESGIDKGLFQENNFIPLNIHTKETHDYYRGRKSSDETDVHLAIFQATEANCVLHSHMVEALHFCDLHKGRAFADIKGLELLKGFNGVKTHETIIQIPIFENTQDITHLSEAIKPSLKLDHNCYGVLLAGHGIYVWGKTVQEAKRHLEVFEYIFKYYIQRKQLESK